ncbi:alpha/beta fold hydrolase [Morganella morganii]|uniref:alpha/beta fold hydrolase n=1 Tax=Morganella morganii TaxID=582 RepID=UPI0012F1D65B|nr:alpha/beta hydrolase [Morganella morganii]EBR0130310.1 alpha/beta hydrolase [Salmonella enterica subsp. enterica serovar Ajiobo]MBT0308405.1 alpha/beta hydrolase [Morganella morganii subsp. morganii]
MRKAAVCALLSCLLMAPAMASETQNTGKETVRTENLARQDGSAVHYYLLHRQAEPTRKLLVLIQGSDCNSARNNRFMVDTFGGAFPDHDILLVEKYGITDALSFNDRDGERADCPAETMLNDSLSVRVSDYAAVLDRLKGEYDTVLLLGGSEGATVAEHTALASPVVDAVVAVNGGGRFFLDDVTDSFRNSPQQLEESQLAGFLAFTDAVKRNEVENDMLVSQHGMRWWREFLAADAQQVLNGQTKPVLVIQTLNDTNVSVTSFKQMQKAVGNQMVTFRTFDNLDHYFKDTDGNRHTAQILAVIRDWYARQ